MDLTQCHFFREPWVSGFGASPLSEFLCVFMCKCVLGGLFASILLYINHVRASYIVSHVHGRFLPPMPGRHGHSESTCHIHKCPLPLYVCMVFARTREAIASASAGCLTLFLAGRKRESWLFLLGRGLGRAWPEKDCVSPLLVY